MAQTPRERIAERQNRTREHLRQRIEAMADPVERVSVIDGQPMSSEYELRLNAAFAYAFKGRHGKILREYLRRITVDSYGGPDIDDRHLRHLEGQRYLYGVMMARRELGEKGS